jgi:hypothetical protein
MGRKNLTNSLGKYMLVPIEWRLMGLVRDYVQSLTPVAVVLSRLILLPEKLYITISNFEL